MPVIAWIIIAIIAAGAGTAVVVPAVMSDDEPTPAVSTELPETAPADPGADRPTRIETRITDPIDAPSNDYDSEPPARDPNYDADEWGGEPPAYDPGDWGGVSQPAIDSTRRSGGAVGSLPF